MAAMNAPQGPVDGTPIMGNGQRRPQPNMMEPRDQLNTYIFDYFVRNQHHRLARMMIECDLKMSLNPPQKSSPSGRNVNGVDAMDQDSKDDLPTPKIPPAQATDNSFLLDWWVQFWDIWGAAKNHPVKPVATQYIQHTRNLTQMQNEQRAQRMMMAGGMGGQYPAMMRMNGVDPNNLKRAAAMNNRNPNGNPMANMNQMKNPGMMSTQMQRDGSQMEMNGQRSQSPGSNDNGAPSPNKRPRVEGGMNAGNMPGAQFNEFNANAPNVQQKQIEVYAQSLVQQQRMALNNHAIAQGMNTGVQGSPMAQQGMEGQHEMFTGNPARGIPAGAPGAPQGNHALQDYQMQLMLLEQQNKKRLLMARQEQDNITAPHAQGGPGFPASMSPQGSRAGPSPNPADQMKKGTPRMGPQGLPGSPMPEGAMHQQRNSPAPAMPGAGFDPNGANIPPGMHPQYGFPGQMPQGPMMGRPPSSHPGNFAGGQMNPQQMEAMQRNGAMPNGVWRGPQVQPGMMPNPQMGPMGNNPNPQQRSQMPPPPAPPTGEQQPRAQEPSPSQPAQAPPTPSQGNKAAPKKKATKDSKKPANKKGANTGATPAASGAEEPPTPSTPITPHPHKTFGQNGQQQQPSQPPAQQQPPAAPQQQQAMDINGPPFGNIGDDSNFGDISLGFGDDSALENFDFDSFLHVGDDSNGLGGFGGDFGFEVEAGGDQ
ncbi:hypothetical protein K458DRAFT_395859 [Lentithecium fluviatile CBS 122367]|uniref:LisH domain-containing protein n=1 Tax=Lentithecium fluviatile CBS 122367 TaxID=1168545 RepID=A0A6G1IH79_9PLEO|nr:hypothetical protein K458DRAFT_395859 [Lentithecium fluviatile CBS 122367]